jgi:cell fate regulator YaaT (PSP1 superfamily)
MRTRTGDCSKLEMKISDIEFGDGSKLRFITQQNCIDFRALIKDFAKEFSTRIER